MTDNIESLIEAAIFPIPGCVVFPGMTFPLHVFEPRYRTMVKDCVSQNRPLAVAHTQKVVSVPKRDNETDALTSNQATYKPFAVFSAGDCEIVETFSDGRMRVDVHVNQRLSLITEKQTLPYLIGECKPVPDRQLAAGELTEAQRLQAEVVRRLLALVRQFPQQLASIKTVLEQEQWQDKTPEAFSFAIFRLIQIDAPVQQKVLESTSSIERLSITLEVLELSS